jgi:hypothetical protein
LHGIVAESYFLKNSNNRKKQPTIN